MQQRSGKHYLQAKEEYIKTGKLGKITLARTWWHGNGAHLHEGAGAHGHAAVESRLGALPRSGEVARLRSAAVLELPRLSRFRRRAGHRPVHALDRRRPHVHGRGQSDRRGRRGRRLSTTRTAAPRPDTINVLLEYPTELDRDLRSHARARHHRRGVEICGTEGRLWITAQPLRASRPPERGAQPVRVDSAARADDRPRRELPRLLPHRASCRTATSTSATARRRPRTWATSPTCRSGG